MECESFLRKADSGKARKTGVPGWQLCSRPGRQQCRQVREQPRSGREASMEKKAFHRYYIIFAKVGLLNTVIKASKPCEK